MNKLEKMIKKFLDESPYALVVTWSITITAFVILVMLAIRIFEG